MLIDLKSNVLVISFSKAGWWLVTAQLKNSLNWVIAIAPCNHKPLIRMHIDLVVVARQTQFTYGLPNLRLG